MKTLNNYVGLMIVSSLVWGCSSTPSKKTESRVNERPAAVKTVQPKEVVTEAEAKKEVTVDESYVSQLNAAIKAQNDEAISKAASQVLTQTPNDVKALNALALVNYKKGRYEAAKYLLNKALSQHTDNSELHSNLGLVYLALDEKREALKSFRNAIAVNSKDGVAAANLGALFLQEKDYPKAMFALEIAYNKGFRDVKTSTNYAVALVANDKKEEAAKVYDQLMKEHSTNKEVMLNYAIFLVDHQQKYKEGIEYINRLKFVGVPSDLRNRINALENKAKTALQ